MDCALAVVLRVATSDVTTRALPKEVKYGSMDRRSCLSAVSRVPEFRTATPCGNLQARFPSPHGGGQTIRTYGKGPPRLPRDNTNPLYLFRYGRQQKIRHLCG